MGDTTKEDCSGSSRKAVRKEKRSYIFRKWTWIDVTRASSVGTVHLLCVLAPFNFKWEALRFGVILAIMSALSITFSYHRNLAHRSFKLPKWLEYSFAYSAIFALQGHPIGWVSTHIGSITSSQIRTVAHIAPLKVSGSVTFSGYWTAVISEKRISVVLRIFVLDDRFAGTVIGDESRSRRQQKKQERRRLEPEVNECSRA